VTTGQPDAAVYIPNLNGGPRVVRTVVSLAEQTRPTPIVVIDNASTDGSVRAVQREVPDVHVVQFSRNVGFGRALNLGVKRHPARVVIFLNNDIACEPRFIEALLERLSPAVGMVAGVLVQQAEPGRIDSAGVTVDRTLLAFDYLHDEPVDVAAAAEPPLGPTGGAALYRADAFLGAGGFDPHIFAYLEDVDLALRLRLAGVRCALAGEAQAVHAHSATLGSGSAAKNRLMGWSRAYLLRRYGILRDPRLAGRALAAEAVIAFGQLLVDGNAAGLSARVRGWRAAAGLPRRPLPEDGLLEIPLLDALRRRAARRPLPVRGR
jgi:N-acetylglucosaminyl-diphospho-decaprenol L-rhamnosyltransferase